MGKRGRPRKAGARTEAGRLVPNVEPNERVQERRMLYAWLHPTKGPDGRGGSIDQDICDGIGQLHALGLLDGHGHDPQDMRDEGRFWGGHYAKLLKAHGFKTQTYERKDRGQHNASISGADMLFDKMDESLPSYERNVLLSLLVDPVIGSGPFGHDITPWAQSLIDEALLTKGKQISPLMIFPTLNDRELLKAAIRGLCCLVDGALPARWAA